MHLSTNYDQPGNLQQLLISNSCLRNLSNKYNSIINASKSSRLHINGKKLKENRIRSAKPSVRLNAKDYEDEEEDLNIWNYNPYEIKKIDRWKVLDKKKFIKAFIQRPLTGKKATNQRASPQEISAPRPKSQQQANARRSRISSHQYDYDQFDHFEGQEIITDDYLFEDKNTKNSLNNNHNDLEPSKLFKAYIFDPKAVEAETLKLKRAHSLFKKKISQPENEQVFSNSVLKPIDEPNPFDFNLPRTNQYVPIDKRPELKTQQESKEKETRPLDTFADPISANNNNNNLFSKSSSTLSLSSATSIDSLDLLPMATTTTASSQPGALANQSMKQLKFIAPTPPSPPSQSSPPILPYRHQLQNQSNNSAHHLHRNNLSNNNPSARHIINNPNQQQQQQQQPQQLTQSQIEENEIKQLKKRIIKSSYFYAPSSSASSVNSHPHLNNASTHLCTSCSPQCQVSRDQFRNQFHKVNSNSSLSNINSSHSTHTSIFGNCKLRLSNHNVSKLIRARYTSEPYLAQIQNSICYNNRDQQQIFTNHYKRSPNSSQILPTNLSPTSNANNPNRLGNYQGINRTSSTGNLNSPSNTSNPLVSTSAKTPVLPRQLSPNQQTNTGGSVEATPAPALNNIVIYGKHIDNLTSEILSVLSVRRSMSMTPSNSSAALPMNFASNSNEFKKQNETLNSSRVDQRETSKDESRLANQSSQGDKSPLEDDENIDELDKLKATEDTDDYEEVIDEAIPIENDGGNNVRFELDEDEAEADGDMLDQDQDDDPEDEESEYVMKLCDEINEYKRANKYNEETRNRLQQQQSMEPFDQLYLNKQQRSLLKKSNRKSKSSSTRKSSLTSSNTNAIKSILKSKSRVEFNGKFDDEDEQDDSLEQNVYEDGNEKSALRRKSITSYQDQDDLENTDFNFDYEYTDVINDQLRSIFNRYEANCTTDVFLKQQLPFGPMSSCLSNNVDELTNPKASRSPILVDEATEKARLETYNILKRMLVKKKYELATIRLEKETKKPKFSKKMNNSSSNSNLTSNNQQQAAQFTSSNSSISKAGLGPNTGILRPSTASTSPIDPTNLSSKLNRPRTANFVTFKPEVPASTSDNEETVYLENKRNGGQSSAASATSTGAGVSKGVSSSAANLFDDDLLYEPYRLSPTTMNTQTWPFEIEVEKKPNQNSQSKKQAKKGLKCFPCKKLPIVKVESSAQNGQSSTNTTQTNQNANVNNNLPNASSSNINGQQQRQADKQQQRVSNPTYNSWRRCVSARMVICPISESTSTNNVSGNNEDDEEGYVRAGGHGIMAIDDDEYQLNYEERARIDRNMEMNKEEQLRKMTLLPGKTFKSQRRKSLTIEPHIPASKKKIDTQKAKVPLAPVILTTTAFGNMNGAQYSSANASQQNISSKPPAMPSMSNNIEKFKNLSLAIEHQEEIYALIDKTRRKEPQPAPHYQLSLNYSANDTSSMINGSRINLDLLNTSNASILQKPSASNTATIIYKKANAAQKFIKRPKTAKV